jgi:hypothetical protein
MRARHFLEAPVFSGAHNQPRRKRTARNHQLARHFDLD